MKISLTGITNRINSKVDICRMSIESAKKLSSLDQDIQEKSKAVFFGLITEKEAVDSILNKY